MKTEKSQTKSENIKLYRGDGCSIGEGRIFTAGSGKFGWVHPDGSEGTEDSWQAAVNALEAIAND